MPAYTLTMLIDSHDLTYIKGAGQRITLAKPVSVESPNVIWLSIDPFGSTEVAWEEQYGIYASTTAVQDGARITKMSEAPPRPRMACTTHSPPQLCLMGQ